MSSPSALFPPGHPGVLSAVSEHPRRRGRYRVRLVDTRVLLVDAETVAGLPSLQSGTPLDAERMLALEANARYVACYDRALGALARARRARRELAQRLRRHEPDTAVIERVLSRLAALGLLDDAAVAEAEVAARLRRGEGPARVRQVLARKGVERTLVDATLREVGAAEAIDERESCRAAAEKRLRSLRSLPALVQRRRLTAFLARRGFGAGVVHDVVRELLRGAVTGDD
ncbi:MAG TPA: regulatory protein RecX [Gemmatimonadaceae bacterium]|nr:regulatory protein RecX [Gemmatimonadaceae bacterium]